MCWLRVSSAPSRQLLYSCCAVVVSVVGQRVVSYRPESGEKRVNDRLWAFATHSFLRCQYIMGVQS